jgi:DNA-directed RNA polymerase subunit F
MPRRKIEETDITNAEAKEIIESLPKSPSAFRRALESYLKETVRIEASVAKKIVEELMKEANLTRKDAIMLVNLLPTNPAEIKSILSGGSKPFVSSEQAEKAAEVIKRYKP